MKRESGIRGNGLYRGKSKGGGRHGGECNSEARGRHTYHHNQFTEDPIHSTVHWHKQPDNDNGNKKRNKPFPELHRNIQRCTGMNLKLKGLQ